MTARALSIGASLIGLFQVLFEATLKTLDLMHQALLKLVLVVLARLLLSVCVKLLILLLVCSCFRSCWLAGTFGCSHLLLLPEILE